jgi:NADH dehydrogenase
MNDKLLILGGTGFVGRALCETLNRALPGTRLLVPTRRRDHARRLGPLPTVDVVQADVNDPAALARLLPGCDTVINLVAILHGKPADFEALHVELPRRLAVACAAAAVPRVIHVSALGVSVDAPSNYLRSKAKGEAVLYEAATQPGGAAVTVLRPSVIFGAGDRFLNLFAKLQRIVPLVPLAGAQARFTPVWVGDVASAILACLQDPATRGQTLECAGPEEFTLAQLVRLAGEYSGHPRPIWALPEGAAHLQAQIMGWLPGEPLLSEDNLASLTVPNVPSGTLPGLASLGIRAQPLAGIAPGYLSLARRHALLDALRAQHRN